MGSPAYILIDINNGIGMLEWCMLNIFETKTYVFITGDFSTWTNSENAIHLQSEGDDTGDV